MNKKLEAQAQELANKIAPYWTEISQALKLEPGEQYTIERPKNGKKLVSDEEYDQVCYQRFEKYGAGEAYQKAKGLCDSTVKDLLDQYAATTLSKDCSKIFRSAITKACGIEAYSYQAFPAKLFVIPLEIGANVNYQGRQKVSKQREKRIPLTPSMGDELLDLGAKLIAMPIREGRGRAEDVYSKAIGIELLTGRRMFQEILTKGRFEAIDSHNLHFTGQAKTSDDQGYSIPVLGTTAQAIVKAHEEVLDYLNSTAWYSSDMDEGLVKKQTDKIINNLVKDYLKPVFKGCVLAGVKSELWEVPSFTSHFCRKIYAFLVWDRLEQQIPSYTEFAPDILGHSRYNATLDTYERNTRTSESYDIFRPVTDDYFDQWIS